MRDEIRLVDEIKLNPEQGCTFCANAQGPFVEMPLPAALIGAADFGAVYACGDCFEAACATAGVVSSARHEEQRARAQGAEERAAAMTGAAKAGAETIARLEKQLAEAEARAVVAEGHLAPALARVEELEQDPAVRERELLLARIEAATVERQPRSRKKAAA